MYRAFKYGPISYKDVLKITATRIDNPVNYRIHGRKHPRNSVQQKKRIPLRVGGLASYKILCGYISGEYGVSQDIIGKQGFRHNPLGYYLRCSPRYVWQCHKVLVKVARLQPDKVPPRTVPPRQSLNTGKATGMIASKKPRRNLKNSSLDKLIFSP